MCENNAVVTFFSDSELEQDVVMKSGGSSSPGKKEILKVNYMSYVFEISESEPLF